MRLLAERPGTNLGAPGGAWFRGSAFGVTVASTVPVPGIATERSSGIGGETSVEVRTRHELMTVWKGATGRTYDEIRDGSGRVVFRLRVDPGVGYLFTLRRYGAYLVSADGTAVICAPPPSRPWFWERFVVARALPFATVLRGHEAFHASCVSIGGRAIAFVGDRGDGKTSLAVQLALQGASIVTDDVLAVDRRGRAVLAHPGPRLVSIRRNEYRSLGDCERDRLGTIMGRGSKIYVTPDQRPGRQPLAAIYLLSRDAPGHSIRTRSIRKPDPRMLLAASFVPFIRTTERLIRQLDVCAAIARDVPVAQLEIPSRFSARDVAEHLVEQEPTIGEPSGTP
jgi:hypothetical protein